MITTLFFPRDLFRECLRVLLRRSQSVYSAPLGICRFGQHAIVTRYPTSARIAVYLTSTWREPDVEAPGKIVLQMGTEALHGQMRGWGRESEREEWYPLHTLRVTGAGMQTLPLASNEWSPSPPETLRRWSRTIGALGQAPWERLTGISWVIVGAGRTGSALALALLRLGARRITLIDDDRIELHNLGEMAGVCSTDIRRYKVEAIRDALLPASTPGLCVRAVPYRITQQAGWEAATRGDILLSATDHDSARLTTTALATLYSIPLVEIATGVREHTRGLDVRLTLPGRCLLCLGGLSEEEVGRNALRNADAERDLRLSQDWQQERTGSLASLNTLAVSLAMRMLEDLITGVLSESLWAHGEYEGGHLHLTYPTPPIVTACSLCRLTGGGDDALPLARRLLIPEREQPLTPAFTRWFVRGGYP